VQVHPLYRGCLTLELVNLGTVPIALHPGERIAQLVFMTAGPELPAPQGNSLFEGKYVCPTDPEFSLASYETEVAVLAAHSALSRTLALKVQR